MEINVTTLMVNPKFVNHNFITTAIKLRPFNQEFPTYNSKDKFRQDRYKEVNNSLKEHTWD